MIHLTKWYCDCVSPGGSAFLGYWAKLSWGPFTIPYVATLYRPTGGAVSDRSFLRACPPPVTGAKGLEWTCAPLGVRGRWTGSVPAYRGLLLDDSHGSITWECSFPAARALVELADAPPVAGFGYAERLTLSVLPRHLPFDELRWGRFVSADGSMTWIDWRGRVSRCWVLVDGAEVSGGRVSDGSIDAGEAGLLELSQDQPLRAGRLADTALRKFPAARRWLLRGVPAVHECKWLGRGTFRTGSRTSDGWVIHETVRIRG